jgi:hypothetical protein
MGTRIDSDFYVIKHVRNINYARQVRDLPRRDYSGSDG